jgi:nitroreductase
MDFWDVIEMRHAYRDFAKTPVTRETLEQVLHAAASAPSAMNAQPWRFHVCEGETRAAVGQIVAQATVHLEEYMDVLGPERYEEAVGWYTSLGNAPVVVGVSAPITAPGLDRLNNYLSIGAGIENFMLAATAEGLGTCNVTFAWWVREELADFFELDDDREVLALLVVGYPGKLPPAAPPKRTDVAEFLG